MPNTLNHFQIQIRKAFQSKLDDCLFKYPRENILQADLHCHDLNSDVPDELWGRILGLPETWLATDKLLSVLKSNGSHVVTITNHNNARSCWDLKDKGQDVLVGAEFTCHYKTENVSMHVLTYGFNPDQEEKLKDYRHDLLKFMRYASENDIPTVLPHPLYMYSKSKSYSIELFEKLALIFDRFEVFNGQRDVWQNLLAWDYVDQINEEKITNWSKKHGINPLDFCQFPYEKKITGGSDDHMGIYAGTTGTFFHIPDLKENQKKFSNSQLVLDALKKGQFVPFGYVGSEEKLCTAFLDYFCQVALYMKDPGLIRLMLHKGNLQEKIMCLALGNGLMELNRHKYTKQFLDAVHNSFQGKRPKFLIKWTVSKDYKPLVKKIDSIAKAKSESPDLFNSKLKQLVPDLFQDLNNIILRRVKNKIELNNIDLPIFKNKMEKFSEKLELPMYFRSHFNSNENMGAGSFNISSIMDSLSFPLLASGILAGATLATSKVLSNNRDFLKKFAQNINSHSPEKRCLWLTDTMVSNNGVGLVLKEYLREIQRLNLPIDILTCHPDMESEEHLIVIKPTDCLSFSNYPEQKFYLPNLLDIHKIFYENSYDRLICSTELPMGPIALYLKHAFNVKAFFYMHTDWLEFLRKTARLNRKALDRFRRLFRAFYQQFDGIFVLNSDQEKWLTGSGMGFEPDRVHKTSHWVSEKIKGQNILGRYSDNLKAALDICSSSPTLLFAGRISQEKGIFDLPAIIENVRQKIPSLKIIIAGTGPDQKELITRMPEAYFTNWLDPKELSVLYQASDLLILPSRFDTFGCVVLEALQNSLPVVAYNTKGPKDIIVNGKCGYLAKNKYDMAKKIIDFFGSADTFEFKKQAKIRAESFDSGEILKSFTDKLGLDFYPKKTVKKAMPIPTNQIFPYLTNLESSPRSTYN